MKKLWVLTCSFNDYDQHGDYIFSVHISHNKYMNGQLQNVSFFSGTGESEFIKNNKGSFIFL